MDAGQLRDLLKVAGIPVTEVSIKDEKDRATWVITYAPTATPQQIAAGSAFVANVDPASPAVKDAALDAEAARLGGSLMIRAFFLWWHRETFGKDPDDAARADAVRKFGQAFKDEASRGLT